MKKLMILATALLMAGGISLAYAGDVEKGKALFESPTLGGSTNTKSCETCHPGGKKLGAFKNNWAKTVNTCIEKPLGGTAIDPEGEEMQDLLAYMKTLVDKQGKKKAKRLEGC